MKMVKRILTYIVGLAVLSIGINIFKMSGLGISPSSSMPYALSRIFQVKIGPDWWNTFGVMTYAFYILIALITILILRKQTKIQNILSIPVAILFGYFCDIFGTDPNAFGHLLYRFPLPTNYPLQLLYVAIGCILIALGVFLYLRAKLVSMPIEGLAEAISMKTGAKFGNCKTAVDSTVMVCSAILQIIFLGGFASFLENTTIVREGTLIAGICIGQLVKLFTKLIGKPLDRFLYGKKEHES